MLKSSILMDLEELKIDKAETSVGKFKVTKLKTWTYTDTVINMNEEMKAQKATEESTGEATFVEKSSLRFTKNSL